MPGDQALHWWVLNCSQKKDYEVLLHNLNLYHVNYTELKKDDNAFGYLV